MRCTIFFKGLGVLVYFGYCGPNHMTAYNIVYAAAGIHLQLIYTIIAMPELASEKLGLNTRPTVDPERVAK
jgi:hypothetical protein